jgi:hypothetical protein
MRNQENICIGWNLRRNGIKGKRLPMFVPKLYSENLSRVAKMPPIDFRTAD